MKIESKRLLEVTKMFFELGIRQLNSEREHMLNEENPEPTISIIDSTLDDAKEVLEAVTNELINKH